MDLSWGSYKAQIVQIADIQPHEAGIIIEQLIYTVCVSTKSNNPKLKSHGQPVAFGSV